MSAHRTAPQSAPETDTGEIPPQPPRAPERTPERAPQPAPHLADPATDVVRWAAFSCVLVPIVLVWYGTSLAGATGAALGLAAVTGVCRVLLRQSERGAARAAHATTARPPAPRATPAHATSARTTPAHAMPARSMAEDRAPQRGRHGRPASGAHRGGRNPGPSTPVD
ncbi:MULTISPECIES: hypothetical protein [Streptomyces]|uniref:Uncharacterized protein n=1 Tax=Streptomyces stelliscabiei TaxID=146820 RepID=A0A8I0P7C0_9ACTN|nr:MULTISPECIES: hypothetical protein [Streptomyces]KND41023.1 hypothetical protein IQ64_31365 [Streptomyces stelliscabiei]MBE1597526.1 hypothetical protein [Streptomyces stelliscabiei]MDX2522141.1 hypothetical protein [Streptomyces stelliscabiei]MDX2549825.1 hypothetical protein [Streptomyces stelliscabiei]MDX2610754.1 hypothetical protein [Streptomyces stelliscabiei]